MAGQATALVHEHEAIGATLTEFGGWLMPLRYGSDIAEHVAVRTAAGIFDISHMGQITVSGAQAAAALDAALVGWFSILETGRARYSMIVQPDGGVIDDLVVYRTAEQEFIVVANAGNTTAVLTELRRRCEPFETVDVQAPDGTRALLALQGPRALTILRQAGITSDADGQAIAALPYYAITAAVVAGAPALVARTGYTGEDGFELFIPASQAVRVWRAVLDAGGDHGLVPAGLSARDSLRLEAGMPLYGHELDLTTTPYEPGLGRIVRLDKVDAAGEMVDFVGRAALAARRGSPPARVLVGLRADGRRAPRAGDELVIDASKPDMVIGRVTSGAPSPTLGYPIALAYVTPEFSAVGTTVAAMVRGRGETVTVVALPFYRRPQVP